jgi:stage II sporulation protein D
MEIRVGLSADNLVDRLHSSVELKAAAPAVLSVSGKQIKIASGRKLVVKALNGKLQVRGISEVPSGAEKLVFSCGAAIAVPSLRRQGGRGNASPSYRGKIEVSAVHNQLRLVVITDMETYIRGVLNSEISPSYHLEAIKAQAVAARTYALRPRLSHAAEGFNVCDSYLHCQYFAGIVSGISPRYEEAINQTRNRILTFNGKPILALFSSNAGGHTEDYQNCFSDPITDEFPPAPLPYLKGVPEGKLPRGFPSEAALRALWETPHPETVDAWSPQFRWQVKLSADAIEAHMHHEIDELRKDPQFSPFIIPPKSGKFGHVQRFEIVKRGVSGIAIEIIVHTSAGDWRVRKELTIRSIFKNSQAKLVRLKSARCYFDISHDKLGLLSSVSIHGLGWGHGVGMQQTGAQGWAKRGKTYEEILGHYFMNAEISKL